MRSVWEGNAMWEAGTSGMAGGSLALASLLCELGLDEQLVEPSGGARGRFVLKEGIPRAVPESVAGFALTSLLSGGAKARLVAEPLAWSRKKRPRPRPGAGPKGAPGIDPQVKQ